MANLQVQSSLIRYLIKGLLKKKIAWTRRTNYHFTGKKISKMKYHIICAVLVLCCVSNNNFSDAKYIGPRGENIFSLIFDNKYLNFDTFLKTLFQVNYKSYLNVPKSNKF